MFASSWFRPRSKRPRPTTRLVVEQLEDRSVPSAGSGSYLLVSSSKTDNVLRYDAATGAFVDEFIPHRDGRLNQPWGVVIGPQDHNVYVSTGHFQGPGQIKAVLRYDGTTGAFLNEFVQRDQLIQPGAAVFGPDGNLYVSDCFTTHQGRVARFDGTTGAYLGDFVPVGSGGLGHPVNQVFGPSGRGTGDLDLYVNDEDTGSILRYNGTTGAFLGVFVPGGSGGLGNPTGFVFGPDGNFYVADSAFFGGTPAVLRYQGPAGPTPGAFMGTFVPAGSGGLLQPFGVLFGPDRNGDGQQDFYVTSTDLRPNLTVSRPDSSSVKVYDGVTGGYLSDFVSAGSGGLNTPVLMTFTETDPMTLAYRPRVSISDVTKAEGKKGQATSFTFTVTLSTAFNQPVTMSFAAVGGTATVSDKDYVPQSGTLIFKPGETSRTVTIEVTGDSKREADEAFYLDLFGLDGNALFDKSRGIGTILNND
jgi:hypothetical protein